ncbi:MAG: peptide antibiotic transporter SbmA [Acetobacteraceae bacterium]
MTQPPDPGRGPRQAAIRLAWRRRTGSSLRAGAGPPVGPTTREPGLFRSFFMSRRWIAWSIPGGALILFSTWYKVELDVQINEWFGSFYNMIQKALGQPGSVSMGEYFAQLMTFGWIAGLYVLIAVLTDFLIKHYVFRWRTAMNEYYTAHWDIVRTIEGASQRVQEDTMRFARLVEGLGVSFMRSVMTLIAFLPILWTLSAQVKELPWIGPVNHALVWVAILFALAGTVLMALVGFKLPGLEFDNQRVEAAYRKELVYGEDDHQRAEPEKLGTLFSHVRRNYFRLFFHYMYFDVARWSYLQFGVLVPYIALGPTLVSGAITLGVMQQIVRAFGRVEGSFQYLVNSWTTIVELMSVYKRLRAFEHQIRVSDRGRPHEPLPQTG